MWKKTAVELPVGVHRQVAALAKSFKGGKRGLGRYVWTAAVMLLLEMDKAELECLARKLREIAEKNKDSLAHLFADGSAPSVDDVMDMVSRSEAIAGGRELKTRATKTAKKPVAS